MATDCMATRRPARSCLSHLAPGFTPPAAKHQATAPLRNPLLLIGRGVIDSGVAEATTLSRHGRDASRDAEHGQSTEDDDVEHPAS